MTRCTIIVVARVASLTQVTDAADFWNPTGHEARGRPTCRRNTATSWRNVSSSAMTADSLRARTASHRNKHTMIR